MLNLLSNIQFESPSRIHTAKSMGIVYANVWRCASVCGCACNLRDFSTFTHSFCSSNNNLDTAKARANWISYLLNIPTCNIILNFNIFISFVRLIASCLPVYALPNAHSVVVHVHGNYTHSLHVQIKNSWNICSTTDDVDVDCIEANSRPAINVYCIQCDE